MRSLKVGLTDAQKTQRRFSIGGSDANVIASGDADKLHRLWQEKTGAVAPADLTGDLAVMMGSWTEELNRWWFERATGLQVTREGEVARHDKIGHLTATLDGMTVAPDDAAAVFEAKHVNAFNYQDAAILKRYAPQLHHNMFVVGAQRAVLSVFVGTLRWEHYWIEFDPFYHADLLDAEERFWRSVQDGTPPGDTPELSSPNFAATLVDMQGNNQWAVFAADYISTRPAVRRNKEAGDGLRDMLPKTARAASGHGITLRRDVRGVARITVEKEDEHAGI